MYVFSFKLFGLFYLLFALGVRFGSFNRSKWFSKHLGLCLINLPLCTWTLIFLLEFTFILSLKLIWYPTINRLIQMALCGDIK